ncbi:unnamed protein product [Musa textilis]
MQSITNQLSSMKMSLDDELQALFIAKKLGDIGGFLSNSALDGIVTMSQDMGPTKQILGIQISRDRKNRKIWLSQEKYIEKVLERFSMSNAKLVDHLWHHVLTTSDNNRRSIASFYNPSLEATIALGTNKDDSATALYPKYTFGDYMDVYVKERFLAKEPWFAVVRAV